MTSITPTELQAATGISLGYASMLLSGKRTPSVAKALHIFDRTGLKLGILVNLAPREIDKLREAA